MPGLNQLKQFTSDVEDLGDEVKLRAQRGEKPAKVPFPEGISEEDDSEDFVLGVPDTPADVLKEKEEASQDGSAPAAAEVPSTPSDDSDVSPEEAAAAALNLDAILNAGASPAGGAADVPDLSEFETPVTPEPEEPKETPLEDLDLDALLNSAPSEEQIPDIPADVPAAEPVEDSPAAQDADNLPPLSGDDFALPDFDSPAADLDSPAEEPGAPSDLDSPAADLEVPEEPAVQSDAAGEAVPLDDGLGPVDDFAYDGSEINLNEDLPDDIAETDAKPAPAPEAPSPEESAAEEGIADDGLSALDSLDGLDDLSMPEPSSFDEPVADAAFDSVPDLGPDAGLDSIPDGGLDVPSEPSAEPIADTPAEPASEAPAAEPSMEQLFNTDDLDTPFAEQGQAPDASMDVPAEEYDLSAMDGVDFSEEASSAGDADEFPVTEPKASSDDDFILDENYEIPGFSDIETANFDPKRRKVDVADFSQAKGAKPKNTLTDEEYAKFKKNLSDYPLNLRLAIEDLIVKNEFTDDAVFEVVEKVLKKAPARQVATHLEKMLDISIDVPRDYERRSFAQYEAYKQSFQYQLKNRIIPGAIAGVIILILGTLLFQASVMFIYKPSMARMYYKQGYALLQNNEYPQSEERFKEAVHYKAVRKWFFKYAHGYREHKQYERAAQMYRNILGIFDHDKEAGIEWAQMELYERANYEQAEKITRREILDYHINAPEGLLLLGDIFLEWAETDPAKYDLAREQYSNLIQLYGGTDLYMSRMLRYFIRTDKLRNVIELKSRFYPNEKSLCAEDWVELSGYLLDKNYGPLSRSDEYLRSLIEDIRSMLEIAEKADPSIPAAHYNMARYFIHNGNFDPARAELKKALDCYNALSYRSKKNIYGEIDSCRILGELYTDTREYLKAQEVYTRGITLFQNEKEKTGFEGDHNTGLLYADMGDIEYFISGDMDAALSNYEQALNNKNDTPTINYRIGAINYGKQEYEKALTSFIKTAEEKSQDTNLLLSLGNVLSLRGDNFAAQGYYSHLLSLLDAEKARHLMLFPQERLEDNQLVESYLKVNNNLGVTLHRIAKQTGDSQKNAEALVRLSDSIRAWDALTRNPETMVRLGGSNLALQNSKYITTSKNDFEPAIYTDIPRTLVSEKVLK
ncbi:MAG: tetratricopeptide repeat protein [Treponema sp.]|nr:tetratricopeptide repeat protein [Treponema sp.]